MKKSKFSPFYPFWPIKFNVCECVRGAISPVLANIFMDIVFDKWFERHYPKLTF